MPEFACASLKKCDNSYMVSAGKDSMGQEESSAENPQSITALVVDDIDINRDILIAYVKREGHGAVGVGSANAAWEYLQENTVDLLLLDYMMPGRNGLDFLRQLRGDPRFAELPVIMVSAHPEVRSMFQGNTEGAGVVGWLSKPFEREELLEVMGRALSRMAQSDAASGKYRQSGEY